MKSHFFAYISRMRFIQRWALMRNTAPENVQEHSHQVAVLAHALAVIRNERFGGRVPDNMEDLTSLPGVGRKTANLILGDVYGQPSYVCDTHCIRITGRLGITDGSKDPLKVEQQLRKAIPPAESGAFCHRMVLFGRDVCTARSPKCEGCPLRSDCAAGKKLK